MVVVIIAHLSRPWSIGWVALSFLVRCSFVPLWWHFLLLRKKSIFLLFLVRSSSPLPKSCQSFPNEKKRWMWYSTTQIYYLFVKLCLLKFVDWLALPLLLTLFGRRAVHTQIQKWLFWENHGPLWVKNGLNWATIQFLLERRIQQFWHQYIW